MPARFARNSLSALLSLLVLTGCGGNDTPPPPPPVAVQSVLVSPGDGTVAPGATLQLTAQPRDVSGNAITGRSVTWVSQQPTIATVDGNGIVTGVGRGTATINATADGRTGTATVVVAVPPGQRCDATQPITVGQTVTSSITTLNCQLADTSYADKWVLTLAQPTAVRIGMTSTAVDSYLLLQNGVTGAVVAENDDGFGRQNSRIEQTLPAGRYVIVATTFEANDFGDYTLSVTPASPSCLNATAVTPPDTLTGTLTAAACVLHDTSYADRYSLTVARTSLLTVNMRSAAIDPFLIIESSTGDLIGRDDDSGNGADAFLAEPVTPGTYFIYANSALPRQTGAYSLSVLATTDECAADRVLAIGAPITDTLSTGGCSLGDGSFAKRYSFTVAAPTALRLDMTSTAVDPYLMVQQAGAATTLAEDDDNGTGLNAQILRVFAAGTYVITATSATAAELGTFTLQVSGPGAGTVTAAVAPTTAVLPPGATQQLTATIGGSTNTGVIWSSSAPGIATVSSTGEVRAITAGTATITAQSAADASKSAQSVITVSSAEVTNLDIPLVYLMQSVQTRDGRVPLVANRTTVARVFVRGSRLGLGSAAVRLRFFNGATVVSTLTGTATISGTLDEGCCSADFTLPSDLLRNGLTMVADADPDNLIAETNETDNAWPLTGASKPISLVNVPDVRVQIVPIRHRGNGLAGPSDTRIASLLPRLLPVARFTPVVHAEFETDLPPVSNSSTWITMLRQMEILRGIEQSSDYYFGVLNQQAATGIIGIANLAGFTGLSVSGPDAIAQETFSHEFGHLFGRRHSPTPAFCGNPENVDPSYPFSDGTTGVFGYDVGTNTNFRNTAYDVMGYCTNTWISVYTYRGILDYLRSGVIPTLQVSRGPSPVLLLSGAVHDGAMVLDPVFSTTAPASPSRGSGQFVAEGYGSDGRLLFTHRFDGTSVPDLADGTQTFMVAVPHDAATQGAVARVEVREARGSAQRATLLRAGTYSRLPDGVNLRTDADPQLRVTAAGNGRYAITWNPARYPSIAIRNRVTGAVLSIGRSGSVSVSSPSLNALDILLSDGVSSVTRALALTEAP